MHLQTWSFQSIIRNVHPSECRLLFIPQLELFQQQENETRIRGKKQKAISHPSVMKSDLEYGTKLDH